MIVTPHGRRQMRMMGMRQRACATGRRRAFTPVRYGAIGNATEVTREDT
jgi:hypothetical protein